MFHLTRLDLFIHYSCHDSVTHHQSASRISFFSHNYSGCALSAMCSDRIQKSEIRSQKSECGRELVSFVKSRTSGKCETGGECHPFRLRSVACPESLALKMHRSYLLPEPSRHHLLEGC